MIASCLEHDDAVLFANDDWCLSADGLEHRDSGYFISRSALAARRSDGLWTWPLQLAEKSWCAPRAFREAFVRALDLFGVEQDAQLARSFAIGSDLASGSRRVGGEGFVPLGALLRPLSSDRDRRGPADVRSAAERRKMPPTRVSVGAKA